MELDKTSTGAIDVIRLPARLSMTDASDCRHAIRDMVDQGRTRLVMDMSQVEFVDSSGLSVLVSAIKAARAAGGDVVLSALTPPVQALVELTRLHHLFEIFSDSQAGADYLDSRAAA